MAKEIAEREAMLTAAQLQSKYDQGQLELSNKAITEVHKFGCCWKCLLTPFQLQEMVNARDAQIAQGRFESKAVADECANLRRQGDLQVAKIRAANATGVEAELIAERDKLMVR